MDHTNSTPPAPTPPQEPTPNSTPPSSDNGGNRFIPFTEAQLTALSSRQLKYFTEARTKLNYDLELAGQLDDRVQSAIKEGKTIKISPDLTGFICE